MQLAFLGALTSYATYSLILPSPTALAQMDRPEELHSRLILSAILTVAIGVAAAHFARHHAPATAALAFSGLVSAIYLIEEHRG